MESQFHEMGRSVAETVERTVKKAVHYIELARYVKVATTAELGGASPFSTTTGPNGTTHTLAAVWIDDDPEAGRPVRIPVAPGVTVQEGKQVYLVKDRVGGPWTWILFQLP